MNLLEQLEWEKECQVRGSNRYYENQQRLRDTGQGDNTDVMSFLIKDRLEDAAEYLEDLVTKKTRGKGSRYNGVIRSVADGDYLKITYIGLRAVLKAIQIREKNTVLKVTLDIASRIEAELKCKMFEAAYPEYYDTVRKSFAQQNITDYVHKHKVMMKKFGDFELEWNEWSPTQKVQVGTRVLRAILNVFGDVIFAYNEYNRGKKTKKLDTTEAFDEWSKEFEKEKGLLNPLYLPLKIPARGWNSITNGGYHSTGLRLKFVKTKGKDHREFVAKHPPERHFQAVNKLQRTAWQVNKRVLKVQEEVSNRKLGIGMPSGVQIKPPPFPEHLSKISKEDLTDAQKVEIRDWKIIAKRCYGREQQRKGQVLAFMQGHKLAKELQDWDKFYYAYTCDFRGRIYCATSGLSPQGSDTSKGLLHFANRVTLGKFGVKWLAIHGANTYGEDKLSYEDRVKWINEQETFIKQVVDDPIEYKDFWSNADKPYQFLAFCFEWADCDYGRNINAKSQLPVGLDGSCNGLQHFSALLRDEVGAKATNLLNSEKPEDIYQEVADETIKILKSKKHEEEARIWLKVGVTRKCAKRPVMTLPYGATQASARTYIMEYVMENWSSFNLPEERQWEMAKYLTPHLWTAINRVVVAARVGMDWLQRNIGDGYAHWLTPLKFPVYQYYKYVEPTKVRTQLDGEVQLWLRDFDQDGEPKKTNQRNGIAPNFVHSIDSTHMVMTINSTDLNSYAMIHDDFGTHAGMTETLFNAIRKTFLVLYTKFDPLEDWAKQMNVDTESIPEKGEYRIEDILDASFFFG